MRKWNYKWSGKNYFEHWKSKRRPADKHEKY